MKYEIFLGESGKYVRCHVYQPITSKFAVKYGQATTAFALERGLRNQLIDVRGMPNVDSVQHNYDFAYIELQDFEEHLHSRVAILADPTDRTHDFVEVVSRNAGYNVKVFIDEKSAIEWLEHET
jgi:hypothetical protein